MGLLMGQKKGKGKGGKSRSKGRAFVKYPREVVFADEGQEYAHVLELYGHGRLRAYCNDGVYRLCHLRGSLWKRGSGVVCGDIILVSLRAFQGLRADVVLKYLP